MRPFERRSAAAYPYYKLATWDELRMTWRDGNRGHDTVAGAMNEINQIGKYRVSRVDETGKRTDLEPFTVDA